MKNCLFVGNGLNLTLNNYSWNNLLSSIADYVGTESIEGISLPLEFERLMNIKLSRNPGIQDKNGVYSKAKARAIAPLKNLVLTDNSVHEVIPNIGFDTIITTNYDFMIEKAFNPDFIYEESNEQYCDNKTSTINGVDIYHAHGSIASTKSVCLGFEHYVKILNHIRNDLSAESIKAILERSEDDNGKWYHKFFTDNVYIVGFGLSESEIDIWSLITKRASLYYRDKDGLQSRIDNRIVYYEIVDDIFPKYQSYNAKLALLEAEHIEVKRRSLTHFMEKEQIDGEDKSRAYRAAYLCILKEIAEEIKCQD